MMTKSLTPAFFSLTPAAMPPGPAPMTATWNSGSAGRSGAFAFARDRGFEALAADVVIVRSTFQAFSSYSITVPDRVVWRIEDERSRIIGAGRVAEFREAVDQNRR